MRLRLPATLLSVLALGCASSTGDFSTPTALLESSNRTLDTLRPENETLDYFLARSRGVLLFPRIVRGGLIFGVAGGKGVLVERSPAGSWGSPSFVSAGGVSFGIQAGVEASQVAVVIMNDRLLTQLRQGLVDFGAGLRLAAGPAGVQAAGSLQTYDAYVYRDQRGAFAGVALDGAIVKMNSSLNSAFNSSGSTEGVAELQQSLAKSKP